MSKTVKTLRGKIKIEGEFGDGVHKHHWWIDLPVMIAGHVAFGVDFMPLHSFYERNIVLLQGVIHWSLHRLLTIELKIE